MHACTPLSWKIQENRELAQEKKEEPGSTRHPFPVGVLQMEMHGHRTGKSKAKVVPSKENEVHKENKACKDNIKHEEDRKHKHNSGTKSSNDSNPVLATIPAFEEEEQKEEAEEQMAIDTMPMHTCNEKEEEEPDRKDHTTEMIADECRTVVTPMAELSQNLGNTTPSGIC